MLQNMEDPAWMQEESVQKIPRQKLLFLEELYRDSKGKSQRELIAMMVPMMKRAKEENLTFTPEEMNITITAIRKYSSKQEMEQIDKILKNKAGL